MGCTIKTLADWQIYEAMLWERALIWNGLNYSSLSVDEQLMVRRFRSRRELYTTLPEFKL